MAPLIDPDDCVGLRLSVEDPAGLHASDRLRRLCNRFDIPWYDLSPETSSPSEAALPLYDPWERNSLRTLVENSNRTTLLLSGSCTEGAVSFTALRALADAYDVLLVVDAITELDECAGQVAQRRLFAAGVVPTTTRQLGFEMLLARSDAGLFDDVNAILGVS